LACHANAPGLGVALDLGTVAVTALVLAVDAAVLGTTDLRGTRRAGPVALFFGILLFWILCYPVAFFRRRHFGRANFGPLALMVVALSFAVQFLYDSSRFGVAAGDVPPCTSREVVGMVADMIRTGPIGPSVQSISGHKESSYDPANQVRRGQCTVKTQTGTI